MLSFLGQFIGFLFFDGALLQYVDKHFFSQISRKAFWIISETFLFYCFVVFFFSDTAAMHHLNIYPMSSRIPFLILQNSLIQLDFIPVWWSIFGSFYKYFCVYELNLPPSFNEDRNCGSFLFKNFFH